MNADPYKLDQTDFARILREIQRNPLADKLPDEPPHPLRKNRHVAALCDHLERTENELYRARKPDGDLVGDDTYFQFDEGLMLRTEVIARLVIDYIQQHPRVLSE